MLCPFLFTKNPPSDPSRGGIPLPLGFQWLPVSRKQIGIFLHSSIELTKVNAKVQTSVFLVHQHDCITPWALTRVDSTHFQHLLHMCLDLIHHGGGILQNCSLKGSSSTTLISCFTRSVQPSSQGSNEKMSLCSANRAWVVTWFASDHPFKPGKSSC